jgi:hypothetical protein
VSKKVGRGLAFPLSCLLSLLHRFAFLSSSCLLLSALFVGRGMSRGKRMTVVTDRAAPPHVASKMVREESTLLVAL